MQLNRNVALWNKEVGLGRDTDPQLPNPMDPIPQVKINHVDCLIVPFSPSILCRYNAAYIGTVGMDLALAASQVTP